MIRSDAEILTVLQAALSRATVAQLEALLDDMAHGDISKFVKSALRSSQNVTSLDAARAGKRPASYVSDYQSKARHVS